MGYTSAIAVPMHSESVCCVLAIADDDIDIFFRRDDRMAGRRIKLRADRNVVRHLAVGQAAVLYDVKVGIGQVDTEIPRKTAAGFEAEAVHAFGIIAAIHHIPVFHRAGARQAGFLAVRRGEIRIERYGYEDVLQFRTAGKNLENGFVGMNVFGGDKLLVAGGDFKVDRIPLEILDILVERERDFRDDTVFHVVVYMQEHSLSPR